MKNLNVSGSQSGLSRKPGEQHLPEAEQVAAADEGKMATYLSQLKRYFISGKKTDESLAPDVYPLKQAPWQSGDGPNTVYPVFYDAVYDSLISLYRHLEVLVELHFDDETSEVIYNELPNLWAAVVQKTTQDEYLAEEIIRAFQTLDLPQKDSEAFKQALENIEKALLNYSTKLFGFNRQTAFQMLNLQMELQHKLKSAFLMELKKTITALNELLMLHGNVSNQPAVQMDFAEDLIAFDKIRNVAVDPVSSQLPQSSLKRLKSALKTLTSVQASYAQGTTKIITSEEIAHAFNLKQIFGNAEIQVAKGEVCLQANIQSEKETAAFVKAIAALRTAKLMIDQKYDEGLHDDYFDQFDLSHLTKEDLKYLHPIFVIEDARQLSLQSNDFLALLSNNSFVKVLGLNQLEDLFDVKDQDDHLELAAMAIFRRNSYVFQGGIHQPSRLREALRKGLGFAGAVFWNILIPSEERGDGPTALSAAVESRYFPDIEYEGDGNHFSGNQINLRNNPDADAHIAAYEQAIKSSSGTESLSTGSTIADFLAMDSGLRERLEIIPPGYQSNSLIPLHEYLTQPEGSLSGQMPFIWVLDRQNKLRRAAIPVYWVQKCRSRLEYWSFLQSISGKNKADIQGLRAEWEKEKNAEIERLKSALQEQYEKEKSSDLEEAVVRMLYGLLNQEGSIESVLANMSKAEYTPAAQAQQAQTPPAEEPTTPEKKEEPAAIIKEEAWVESDECTSCKDCVDALPAVFKYDDNKQAFVHNPKGGTFAEIVKTAEKCPARCIHPGLPQNKSEASLEKWMKRAEKYN